MMSSLVMNNILRYEGKASFAMVGLVTGGLLNILLDPLFIFGLGMGTGGAGLATGLSQMVSFGILLSMYLRGQDGQQAGPEKLYPRPGGPGPDPDHRPAQLWTAGAWPALPT